MKQLCFIFNDQLSEKTSCLKTVNKKTDTILLVETHEEATYVKHHKKKLLFLWSAQRHFATFLKKAGYRVVYTKYNETTNTHSVAKEIKRIAQQIDAKKIVTTHPGEYRQLLYLKELQKTISVPLEILPDDRFFATHEEFEAWAKGKKQLRMEFFYREMRSKHAILMASPKTPLGGSWNYDKENREAFDAIPKFKKRPHFKIDSITKQVKALVEKNFGDHFGDTEPFVFGVTRTQALKHLKFFINHCLAQFGTYQDAMLLGEPFAYHSVLSLYLNSGLLLPSEVCKAAEDAYQKKLAPLNAVEGFIRQILGWREFIRGIYWSNMPKYKKLNFFKAKKALPQFYWTGNTNMRCIAEVVRQTKENAYSHHIQRLMVTGNFALIAGIDPDEVCEWYLIVYADAYDWVELPNTRGMALFADGGIVGSKPYAASGNYINKMSNFCDGCSYDPKQVVGEKACPFNSLYWNFLNKNKDQIAKNPRLAYAFAAWNKMTAEKKKMIIARAQKLLKSLNSM